MNKILKLMLAATLSFGFSAHATSEKVESSDKFITLEQFQIPEKYIEAKGAEDLIPEEKTELAEESIRIKRETGMGLISVFGAVLFVGGVGGYIAAFNQARQVQTIAKFIKANPSALEGPYGHKLIKQLNRSNLFFLTNSSLLATIAGAGLLFYSSTAKAATLGAYYLTEEGFPEFLERYQTDEEVRDALTRHTDFRDGLVEQFYAVKGFLEKEEIRAKTEKSEFIFPLLPLIFEYL